MINKKKIKITNIISFFFVLIIAFYPIIISTFLVPSDTEVKNSPSIQIGTVNTQSGNNVTIEIMLGDVFNPQMNSKDIGFDLVGVSCYFDPLQFGNKNILPSNPLLNSAIRASASCREELSMFIANLFRALDTSRDVILCYMKKDKKSKPCEGDKIEPYVWAVYDESPMFKNKGIKYIGVLPLFNPEILHEKISSIQVRERLSENVENAVNRLLGYSLEELKPTVRSVAFAALGSTSHSSDSDYFMNFETGFLSILKGIQQSHTHSTLKRIYLVGYYRHQDIFLKETIDGLIAVAKYFLLRSAFSTFGNLTFSIYTILWVLSAIFSYQQLKNIWMSKGRWPFFATIVTSTAIFIFITYNVTSTFIMQLHPKFYKYSIVINILTTTICYFILLILSKRITISRFYTKH